MRFKNKVVLVTGASLGIGRAAADAFAREAAHVGLISSDPKRGEEAAQRLRGEGRDARFLRADVSIEADVEAAIGEALAIWGRVDVLVNNAGIYAQGNVLETVRADWESILATNLTGSFLTTRYAAAAMVRQGGGAIVNVSSEAGLVGIRGQVAYNVSKAGMIALTKSCAVDLAEHGVRVNCVCPGTTDTPLVQAAIARSADPAAARRNLERIRPLDRLGTPEEIATAILYLAADEAAYVTGAILSVDGGYTAL